MAPITYESLEDTLSTDTSVSAMFAMVAVPSTPETSKDFRIALYIQGLDEK